ATKRARAALIPRAIVTREKDNRLAIKTQPLQRTQYFSHAPIQLFDHVAIEPTRGLSLKPLGCVQRDVRHVVREIEKERLRLRAFNETDGLFCVAPRQRILIRGFFDDLIVSHERRRSHVVAVRDSKIVIKAVIDRAMRLHIPEMPLANASGRVASILQGSRNCYLGLRQTRLVFGKKNIRQLHLLDSHPGGVASGHQRGSRWRADRRNGVEAGESETFGGHAIEIRSPERFGAITTKVTVAHIVGIDEDDVW